MGSALDKALARARDRSATSSTAAPMTPFESYGRRGATRAPAPAPERTGGFGDELSAAIDNWQAGFGHIGGMLGSDSARDWALEQERQAQEALARSSWAQSLDDIEGVGDIPSYLGHLAVQLVPFAGEVVAGAATGGGSLGAKIGLQTLGKATAKKLAKTDAGRAALRRNAARALDTPALRAAPAREARTLAGRQAFNDLSNTTTRRISGAIASYPSSVGQIAGAQQEQAGEYNAAAALALGAPFAGLNLLGIEGAALRGLPRGASQRRVLRSLAAAGATSATEGGAEVGQTFLEEVGRKSVDSSHDMLGAEAARRYTEAFVGGAALGGVFGGVSGAATSPKVNTDAILQEAKDRTTQEGDALRRAREGAASLQASTLGQVADVAVGAEVGAGLNSLQYNELTVPAILQQLRDRVAGVNVEGVPEKQLSRAAVEIRKIAADPDAAGTSEWLGRQSELVTLASDERAAERAASSATVEEAVAEAYENTVGGFASLDEAQEMLSARLKEAGVPPEMGKKAKALLTRAYRKNNAEAATKILREGFASMRNDANAEVQSRAPAIALAMASMDVLNNIRDINDQRAQAALESEAARLADVAAQQEERDARLSRDAEYRAMQEQAAADRRAEQARAGVEQAADSARRWQRARDTVFGPQSPEVFTTGTPADDVASARAVAEQSLSDGTRDMSDVIAEADAAQAASDTARTLADVALPAPEATQQQTADIEADLEAEDRSVRTKMLDEVIEKAFSNDAGRNPDVISAFYTALRDKGFKGDRAQATPQELNRMRYALQFRRAELDAGIEPLEVEDAKRQAGEAELVMIEEALANIDASAPQVSGEGVAELEGQIPPADASARVAARQERQSDARQQRPWLRVPPAKVRAVRKALDHYDRVQSKLAADGTTDVKPYSNRYVARNAEQKAELRLLDLIIESNPEASDVDVDNFFNRLTAPEAYPNTRRTLRFDPDRDTDMPGQATEARRKRTPQEQADYDNARRMRAEGRAAAGVVEGVAGIQNRATERATEEQGRAAGRAISRAFAEGIRNLEAVAERVSLERLDERQALTEYSDRPFRTAEDERSFSAISKRGGTVVGGVPVSATITFNHEGQDVEVYTAGRPGSEMFYLPQEGGPSIPLGNTLKKATAKFKQVMAAGNVTPAVRTDQSATDVISDAITSRIEQAVAGTQREATSTDTSPDLSDKPVTLRNINAALEEANVDERLVRNKGRLRFEGGDADTWGDLADVKDVRKLSAMSIDEWVGEAITRSEAAMDAAEEAEVAPVDEAMDAGVDPYEGYDEFVDDYEGERALTEFDEGGELEGLEEVEMEADTGPFEGADEAAETSLNIPSFLDRRGELKEARRTSQHFGPIAVTDTLAENIGDVDAALRKELKRMGLGRLKLRIRDKITASNSETGETYAIEGSFFDDIITVALDAKRGVMSAMKHETIHALKEAGVFTPGEWKALTRYAKRRHKKAMAVYSDLSPEKQLEEAVAVSYQDFFEGRSKPQTMVARALTKVKNVLAAIGNALTGAGFNSGADILARVESGEVGARALSQEAGGDISFSTREGRGREFDAWFEGSKVVDDNGGPLTVYHATTSAFDAFNPDGNPRLGSSNELGSHFAVNPWQNPVPPDQTGSKVYPVNLSIKNPLELTDKGRWDAETVIPQLVDKGLVPVSMLDEIADIEYGEGRYRDSESEAESLRDIIIGLGYDGVRYLNRREGVVPEDGNISPSSYVKMIRGETDVGTDAEFLEAFPEAAGSYAYIAFEPSQIKSVFNPMPEGAATSPLFSTREGRGREFDAWFEGSKIVDDNGEPLTVYHGTKRLFDTFKAAYSDGLIFFSTNPEFASKWPVGSGGLRDGGPEVAAAVEEARSYQRELEQQLVTPEVDRMMREEEGFEAYDRVRNEVRQRMMDRFGVPSYLDIETKAGIRVIPVNLSIKNPFDPRTDFSVVEPLLEKMPSMDGIVANGLHKEGNWVVYENADVINHLREAGYDGIWLAESVGGPHETIAAFEPEQIKSVFNPMPEGAAQSPQFSRADALDGPMTIDEAGGMTIKPTVTTGSLLNPGNWPSLIRQLSQNQGANVTYGRTHTGLFMSTLPQIEKRYRNDPMVEGLTKWFAGVDKRGAEVSKLMFGVPGEGDTDVTTPRAIRAAWNDMLASDQTKSEHRARDVEDMLYAASNYNVDPRVGVNDEGNLGLDAEQQRTHAILKDRFDKMDKQQQALFDSILKRYRANLEEKHRLLTSLVDDAEGLSAADKRQAKSQLDTMFNERRVYFPQARFGDFIVSARTPAMVDAENEVARRRQTVAGLQDIDADEAQIQAAQQALNDATAEVTNLKENGNYFVSAFDTPAQQKMASEYWTSQGMIARSHTKDQITSALDGVSGNFLARMREEMADVEGGNELLSTMERVYFTTLPETRAAKRALRREGIPGYTKDARRTFEWSMNQDVRQIAELKFREETQTALQEFMDSTKNVPDSHPRKQEYQVLRQIIRKHNQMGLDSEGANTPVQNFANNLAHLWFLGSTPSFLALNLMQPYMMAVPMISAKYGKPGKVSQQIARASKDVASLQWGALKKGLSEGQSVAQALDGEVSASALGAKPAEVELLRYLMDRGLIDLTQVIELAGTISGENQWSRFMHMATKGAHITEKVNRLSVALAAYRTATEANATEADARQFTVDILNESQFNYSGTAAPLLWKTMPGSKVLLQFRKYQQHMAYALVNNFWQAVKGGDPETRRVARRTLTGIVATHGVMAGSLGLPGATFVMAAADAIANTFGDEDEPWDTENELRLLFSDVFGDQAGMMFAKGLPTGAGVDISSRIGLQDIFSPVQTRSVGAEGRQKWNEYMAAMLGPTASIGADFADGMSRLEDDPLKAWELSMPKLVRDLIRGASQASGGVKTRSGMPIIDADDITMGDALGQMLGLPSTKLTETYQSRSTVMTRQKRLQKRRQQLLRRYVKAALDGDTVGLSEVMAEMRDYNKVRIKNKEPLIKATDRRNAIRRWQRNEREMVRGNVLPRTQVGMHDRTTPYQTY